MGMQDGCKVYMDPYMASNESCFMVTWIIFKTTSGLGGRPNTKPGDHCTPNARMIYSNSSCVRTNRNRNSFEIAFGWRPKAQLHMTSHNFTLHVRVREHTTWFWRCLGKAFGHFLLGSQFHDHSSWLVCEVALVCAQVQGPFAVTVITSRQFWVSILQEVGAAWKLSVLSPFILWRLKNRPYERHRSPNITNSIAILTDDLPSFGIKMPSQENSICYEYCGNWRWWKSLSSLRGDFGFYEFEVSERVRRCTQTRNPTEDSLPVHTSIIYKEWRLLCESNV